MKIFKIIATLLLIAFIGIQFIPSHLNKSQKTFKSDFILVNNVPAKIKNKLLISCYDCHSNNTYYPWYSKIQPVAKFMENHIIDGKEELNFNDWGKYSDRKKQSKLKFIINQINDGEMPLSSYTVIHINAKFSPAEKQEMIKWMTQKKNSL